MKAAVPDPLGYTHGTQEPLPRLAAHKRRERRQITSVNADPARLADELAAFEETVLQVILDNNRAITEQLLKSGAITAAQFRLHD
ncbi:MAG: hypothetical protein U0232_17330 [Thermomicrobiales bacterium]